MRARSPTCRSQKVSTIKDIPEPAKRRITCGELHPYSLDPHCNASRNMTIVGTKRAKPTRSSLGTMLRATASENGGLCVTSGMCVKSKNVPDVAPSGRLM